MKREYNVATWINNINYFLLVSIQRLSVFADRKNKLESVKISLLVSPV